MAAKKKAKVTTRKSYKKTTSTYSKYLTKRPMWEWVVIYIVIGLVVYAAIYFFVIAKNNNRSMYTVPTSTAPTYNLPGY
jgi:hypothetical protein